MSAAPQPALFEGKEIEIPKTLYVPPAAMRVLLDSFEGPLDLLHYLIRRHNMDILDIPMAELTKQYLDYVDRIVGSELELVADYLLMAATLIDIKSRMLVPQPESEEEEEVEDPRAALVERLLQYARIKGAAGHIAGLPIQGRDCFAAQVPRPSMGTVSPRIGCRMLLLALLRIQERAEAARELQIQADGFSVREAMAHMMLRLREAKNWVFTKLIGAQHASRARVGAMFVGVLQLAKDQLVHIDQRSSGEIVIKTRRH